MSDKNNLKIITPVLIGFALGIGYFMGIRQPVSGGYSSTSTENNGNFNMLTELIKYIDAEYVDTVSRDELIDGAVVHLLQELDPHSYYIKPEEYAQMNESLEGNFDGIGIQFNIQKDTLMVVDPISGGPSAKMGIRAGDRIIKVNDSLIAGIGLRNSSVLKLLKGPKGTKVDLTICRKGTESFNVTITRDKIPIHSVNAIYMLTSNTGYIKVDRFGANTTGEFLNGVQNLKEKGAKKVVIDLRGNGGGYMNAATDMLDAFFEKGALLVYTEGRARGRRDINSKSSPMYKGMEVVVLIDESSASASEIFAGAIQDHDRGIIVGRRSFGKGLVQEQTEWPNGSATRLTIARYYTPSGRCIQKPYNNGVTQYNEEYYHRYENGEMLSKDSIEIVDSVMYKTDNGRIVFGSGGIIPDVFVPIDTTAGSSYLNQMVYSGAEYDFAFDYADQNRVDLLKYGSVEGYIENFIVTDELLKQLIKFGESRDVVFSEDGFERSKQPIKRRLKAYIARNIWNDEGFYPIWNSQDPTIKAALKADAYSILNNSN